MIENVMYLNVVDFLRKCYPNLVLACPYRLVDNPVTMNCIMVVKKTDTIKMRVWPEADWLSVIPPIKPSSY